MSFLLNLLCFMPCNEAGKESETKSADSLYLQALRLTEDGGEGKTDEVITLLEESIRLDAGHVAALCLLGRIYERRDPEIAGSYFKRAIAIDSHYQPAYFRLGTLEIHTGKLREAKAHLLEAVRLDSRDADGWINLGLVYSGIKNPVKACSAYLKAIALDPQSYLAHYNLGNLFHEVGDYKMAIDSFVKAAEIQPDSADVMHNLGVVYQLDRNLEKALECFETSLEINSELQEAREHSERLKRHIEKKNAKNEFELRTSHKQPIKSFLKKNTGKKFEQAVAS